jgi:membrane-associated PAP2 superfamily phosphatase
MWMDLDLDVARKITDRKSNLGELGFELALMSYVTGGLLLIPMCVPAVRRHWPTFVRSSAVFILSMIIGVMGFVQNTKLELHRPRPMEVKELGGRYTFTAPFGSDPACAQCTSFPSSSAGSAFLIATPFFVLRRRHKAMALVFLVAGVGWGSFIGYTRMVPGLHWLTDILWSAAFVFVTASALSHIGAAWRSFGAPDRVDEASPLAGEAKTPQKGDKK